MPQIWELGLTVPDPKLRKDEETGVWEYTEPDWDELKRGRDRHTGRRRPSGSSLRARTREETDVGAPGVLAEAA